MPAKRHRAQADATTRRTLRTAINMQEMLAASGAVILRRSAIGAAALERPTVAAFAEGSMMVTEKMAAVAESSASASASASRAATAAAGYAVREATAAGIAAGQLAACTTPAAAMAVQQRLLHGFFDRLVTHNLAMAGLFARAGNAALLPFHGAARANARRLTR